MSSRASVGSTLITCEYDEWCGNLEWKGCCYDPFSGFLLFDRDASTILGPLFGDIFLKGKFLYSADVQDSYTCILHRIKYVTLFVGTVLPTFNSIYGDLSGLEGVLLPLHKYTRYAAQV